MQIFSKKSAMLILAVLAAICMVGCATKAPVAVEEAVVASVEAPVVVPVPEPVVEEPAPEPVVAAAPSSYYAEAKLAGFNMLFSASDCELVFRYVDFVGKDTTAMMIDYLGKLVNAESVENPVGGTLIFKLSAPVTEEVFNNFVDTVVTYGPSVL